METCGQEVAWTSYIKLKKDYADETTVFRDIQLGE